MIKNSTFSLGVLLITLNLGAATSYAQEDDSWRRIGLSYRAAFNISADFSGLGGFTPAANPGGPGRIDAPPGTIVRNYDDGFVGIDVSGNAGGRTTFWGYNDSAQIAGDTIHMQSSSASASGRAKNAEDDPQHGFEINYLHPLGGGEKWRWGLEGAMNWTDIRLKNRQTLAGNVLVLTHSFNLGGVIPPVTPPAYVGPVDGPGAPQLSDEAVVNSASQIGAAATSGTRIIEAEFYGGRFGTYAEFRPLTRFSLLAGGGFSIGLMDSTFSYADTTTISGLGSQNHAGNDRSKHWMYGAYLRGQATVQVYEALGFFSGVECSGMGNFSQSAGTAKARLNMDSLIYAFAGFNWSF